MTQLLEVIFGELGLSQYLDAFLEQGFDTWETILDITESDLDALGVKLGHRRKLQRRVANSRGIAPDASLVSPTQLSADEVKREDVIKIEPPAPEGRETVAVIVTKRKYRRHPKPDENAPERPPSAYVLFSNRMREELKGRNLGFTEIAKLVGENWQNLTAADKEPFESQAQAMKDKYLRDMAEYKKTPEYLKYQTYLADFRAKHGPPSQDKDASKRVRLSDLGASSRGRPSSTPTSRTSRSGSGTDSRKGSEPPGSRPRVGSVVSATSATPSGSLPSPSEPVLSPAVSNSDRHSDRSPVFNHDHPAASAPRRSSQDGRSRRQPSLHMHLPSLSDVLDGRGLPVGVRASNEQSGFRFPPSHVGSLGPSLGLAGADLRSAPALNGHAFAGDSASHPSFGPPRPPMDGPLPIHALLTSKPESPFHPNLQPHLPNGHAYHVDHASRLGRHAPNGHAPNGHAPNGHAPNGHATLPMVNGAPPPDAPNHHHWSPSDAGSAGYHQHGPYHPSHHRAGSWPHLTNGFSAHQPPSPVPSAGLAVQGKPNGNLDGMSALLKAGELVDRHVR